MLIVAGHCLPAFGWAVESAAAKWVANLVIGGTALFVFISGFLFHHVYHRDFEYGRFLKAKARKVLAPYLFLSIPPVLYRVLVEGPRPDLEPFLGHDSGGALAKVAAVADYLWTGKILVGYWFVPLIFLIFCLSPGVMAFIRLRPAARIVIVCFALLASLEIQRPVANLVVMQSMAYFLPLYLLGVLASIHRQAIYEALAGYEIHLVILIGMTACIQAVCYPSFGNLHKSALLLALPDIVLVQKILMCFALMVFLHRFEDQPSPALALLASTSFGVFFIHPYLLSGMKLSLGQLGYPAMTNQGPLLWIAMTALVTLVSVGLAKSVRGAFKEHSVLLIGY